MKNKTIRSVICICLVALLLCGGMVYGGVRYVDSRIQELGRVSVSALDTAAMKAADSDNPYSNVASLKLNPRS